MYLVIGPGAMGIFAFLGSLSVIGLKNIDEVSGSSAGAILGLMICTGKTFEEIKEFCFGLDLNEISKMNIASLLSNFGFIQHEPIKKVLKSLGFYKKIFSRVKILNIKKFFFYSCMS